MTIEALNPDIPLLLITGFTGEDVAKRLRDAHVAAPSAKTVLAR